MDSPASSDTTKLSIDVSGSIKLSRGMSSGSVISVGNTVIGEIYYALGTSLSLTLYESATAARVQELVRALTYSSTEVHENPGRVVIDLMDAGGRVTSSTVIIDLQGAASRLSKRLRRRRASARLAPALPKAQQPGPV